MSAPQLNYKTKDFNYYQKRFINSFTQSIQSGKWRNFLIPSLSLCVGCLSAIGLRSTIENLSSNIKISQEKQNSLYSLLSPPLKALNHLTPITETKTQFHNGQNFYQHFYAFTRFVTALSGGIMVVLDYRVTYWRIRNYDYEDPFYQEKLQAAHERSVKRMVRIFEKKQGIYIKAAQHMSALTWLLPEQYVNALRPFQDKTPHVSFSKMKNLILQELQIDSLDNVFESFDQIPIASASLAQVHKAVLKSNRHEVAVKLQFPHIIQTFKADILAIDMLARIIEILFPAYKVKWMVDEFNRNIPLELDFEKEAQNAKDVSKNFIHFPWVKVPDVYHEFSTKKVLVMEFEEGIKINNVGELIENNIPLQTVSELLSQVFSMMIFQHGFVHCDPHPGNLLVRKENIPGVGESVRLVLLDHGLYEKLSPDFRHHYSLLWKSILEVDEEQIAKETEFFSQNDVDNHRRNTSGIPINHRLLASMFTARIWAVLSSGNIEAEGSVSEKERAQNQAVERLDEISVILHHLPSQLLLVMKTHDLLRGINRDLGFPFNSYKHTMRFCVHTLAQHDYLINPTRWNWMRSIFKISYWETKIFFYGFAVKILTFLGLLDL